ncbi:hypothetical protein SAMN04487936_10449 [Halobacillus dabanensis]|uniref:Uncharacterized protein n=1 Tax=Halobacillus dabanensis TaxID=240302 RepID=A0A1I3TX32_HALDA|nr:hypothetical protein [Halobacillus dabanensis]SFJ75325.1 hypothetical protein SAMN04487936_10449 [Halobacillus dabanensis]
MDRYRLNDTEELTAMKEKLNIYKGMLRSIKSGNVLEDYLLSKTESYEFKIISEGVMKKMEDYHYGSEERTKQLSAQIQSVTETVSGLKNDIALIKEKMDRLQVHDLIGKMNQIIDTQQHPVKNEKEYEVDYLKEELAKLKKEMISTHQQATAQEAYIQQGQKTSSKTSDFRKLQNMLQSSRQFNPGKNDYYPTMNQNRSYNPNQPTFQRKNKNHTEPPIPKFGKSRGSTSKNRTYINPQMEMYQNSVVRTDSKKNVEESAQELDKPVSRSIDKKEVNVQFKKHKESEKETVEWKNEDQDTFSQKKDDEPTEPLKETNNVDAEKSGSNEVIPSNENKNTSTMETYSTNAQEKENKAILKEENINSNQNPVDAESTVAYELEEESKEAIEKPAKKMEFPSFFSIFQKKN